MSKALFDIKYLTNDVFEFSESGKFQFRFTRKEFRKAFEDYASGTGRSSKWVGCFVRIFNKKFPPDISFLKPQSTNNPLSKYSETTLLNYLRSKGFRVVMPIDFSDIQIIKVIEVLGYEVEGLVNDVYYKSSSYVNQMRL